MAEAQSDEGNQTEVVDLCRDLIRIDTTNFGDSSGPGERKAAEYVAGLLEEVGIEARLYESEPGRIRRANAPGSGASAQSCVSEGGLEPPRPNTGTSTSS